MERSECEKIVLQKWKEIVAIYKQYNPDGRYLSAAFIDDQSEKGIFFSVSTIDDGRELDINSYNEKEK